MTEDTVEVPLKDQHRWIDYAIFVIVTGLCFMVSATAIRTFAEDSPGWVYGVGLFVSACIGWAAGFSGDPQRVPKKS